MTRPRIVGGALLCGLIAASPLAAGRPAGRAEPGTAAPATAAGVSNAKFLPWWTRADPGTAAPPVGGPRQPPVPETVVEPESGTPFPAVLTPPGAAAPHRLMGTGVRKRTFLRVQVYAFGLYVEPAGAAAALAEFAGTAAEVLERDPAFTRRLLALDFGMALRLVMTRTVGGGAVADAFDDALRPRLPRAGPRAAAAAAALARLRRQLDVDEVRRGAEIVFACGPAGRLATSVDDAGRTAIESRALCRALFDVYLGPDPIERDGKRDAVAGLVDLLAGGVSEPDSGAGRAGGVRPNARAGVRDASRAMRGRAARADDL